MLITICASLKIWRHTSMLVNYDRYRPEIQPWPCARWWASTLNMSSDIWMAKLPARVAALHYVVVLHQPWRNVFTDIPWMIRPEPVYILNMIKTGDQSRFVLAWRSHVKLWGSWITPDTGRGRHALFPRDSTLTLHVMMGVHAQYLQQYLDGRSMRASSMTVDNWHTNSLISIILIYIMEINAKNWIAPGACLYPW